MKPTFYWRKPIKSKDVIKKKKKDRIYRRSIKSSDSLEVPINNKRWVSKHKATEYYLGVKREGEHPVLTEPSHASEL